MPLIALVAAALTCLFVPPDAAYASYISWDTMGRLACMLAVVGALGRAGVFPALAARIAARARRARSLVTALVATTALTSMFVTNDMALLVLLPLAGATLAAVGRRDLVPATFVLQGIAANLCGMLLPFGNPQNIYLAEAFSIPASTFVRTMFPPFAASCALVALGCVLFADRTPVRPVDPASPGTTCPLVRSAKIPGPAETPRTVDGGLGGTPVSGGKRLATADRHTPDAPTCPAAIETSGPAGTLPTTAGGAPANSARCLVLAGLLAVSVAAVLGAVPTLAAVAVVFAALALTDLRGLAKTDWGLLVTFAAFFVFSGNLARTGAVAEALQGLLGSGALVPAALFSQVISNVPAAVLLARFTGDWAGLLVGVNVGGAGTPVASLATLIVVAQFQALRGTLGLEDAHGPGDDPAPGRGQRLGGVPRCGDMSQGGGAPGRSGAVEPDGASRSDAVGVSVDTGHRPTEGLVATPSPNRTRGHDGVLRHEGASGQRCFRTRFYLLLVAVNFACLAALLVLAIVLGWG